VVAHHELTDPERKLLDATASGMPVDLRTGKSEQDDPAQGHTWARDRRVRAQFLCELLTGTREPDAPHARMLNLAGAHITGALDLEATRLVCPLVLRDCSFEAPVNLQQAQAQVLRLPGCHLPGLNAKQLETRGDLQFDSGFVAHGEVDLRGAHIGGDLVFASAELNNPDGVALRAGGLTVDQSMLCTAGFTARGEVNRIGVRIGGSLSFQDATLSNPRGDALMAARMSVGGAVFCGHSRDRRGGFIADGEVRLTHARIGGFLSCGGATLNNPDAVALAAGGLTVDQGAFFGDGFTAQGEVLLLGARIAGDLSFTGATLNNPGRYALNASRLSVGQAMFCGHAIGNRGGFVARGQVRIVDAHIAAFLTFEGATLGNPDGTALAANRLTVDQDLVLEDCKAVGEVCLLDGRVNSLRCSGTTLANADGPSLDAEGLAVTHDVLFTDGFIARGEVNLRGAHIGGQLTFEGATLARRNSDRALTLQALDARVLDLRPKAPPQGHVDLTHARTRVLVDAEAVWPQSIGLWNFVYEVLHENPKVDVASRLTWLERDPRGYAPQLYQRLAVVYREAGRDEDARRVAIAKQRRRRHTLNWPSRVWNSLLWWTVGYGYRTWQAGLWLLGFLAVGAAIFGAAHPDAMTVAKKTAGDTIPVFQPWIYSLDVLLPVVNLHQEEFWIPQGVARWWAWLAILAGWLLTTVVVAALSGLLKKDWGAGIKAGGADRVHLV
jgi:hypothetical protein